MKNLALPCLVFSWAFWSILLGVEGNTQELAILTLDHVLEQSEAIQDGMEGECLALLNEFENEKEMPSGIVHPRHLSAAMRRGWWSCAHRIVECLSELNMSFENEFTMESRTINVQMNKLKSLVLSAKPIENSISPAFKWAQSGDELFLSIKFAHKLDAPATIDIQVEEVTFLKTGFVFKASKDHKSFQLELELLDEIDTEASTWQLGSVGTAKVTLKKKESQRKWARLLKSKTDRPGNMHTWWEMQEHYEDELERLEEEEEKRRKQAKKEAAKEQSGEATDEIASPVGDITTEEGSDNGENVETPKKKKKGKKQSKTDKVFRKKIKKLDAELRQKKKEIDEEATEKKKLLDEEYQDKKIEMEQQRIEANLKNETSSLENPSVEASAEEDGTSPSNGTTNDNTSEKVSETSFDSDQGQDIKVPSEEL